VTPDELRARVLHRDPDVIVLDKPAGLPVHAGPKGGANLEDMLDALRFERRERPGLAHRLDRDTSGCLVLGRHKAALRQLGRLFERGAVEKTYWAVVHGRPPADSGTVDAPLRKRSQIRGWWMEVHGEGQTAVTDWQIVGHGDGLAWVECRPRTGRTHQIRVHMAHLGHPILGDPVYGPKDGPRAPMHLHARAVLFDYLAGRRIAAQAEPPPAMRKTLAGLGRSAIELAQNKPQSRAMLG
jgi:RluA family pseudouridine synthase